MDSETVLVFFYHCIEEIRKSLIIATNNKDKKINEN